MRGVCTYDTLAHTLGVARERDWPPDAILVTGDIAQDESRLTYEVFRQCFSELGVPVYCLPGNHDNVAFMKATLDSPPFQFCGHAENDQWVMVMLNSQRPGKASGKVATTELERLRSLLEAHPNKHFLVALHHHPVATGSRWLDTVPLRNPDEFFGVLDQHSNVRCLLWGHIHQVYDQQRKGVRLLATPSTCSQFLPHSDEFAVDESHPPAYRILQLYRDGSVETTVRWCEFITAG